MKNNATARVKIYEDHQMKQEFLVDSKCNIFVIFQDRILPLHKDVVILCSYFRQRDSKQEKVLFLEEDIDASAFLKVLAALYGYSLDFVRGTEGLKIFQVAMLLGVEKILEFFQKDFENNFQQYGIFSLYNVAKKYKLEWLEEKCLSDLITCQFEQFRINKYDLMNSTKETFQQVLKQHQIFKSRGLTQGIEQQNVKSLIEEYSSFNSTEVDVQDVFSLTKSCEKVTQKLLDSAKDLKQITRKRKLTWNCPSNTSANSTQIEVEPIPNLMAQLEKKQEQKQMKVSELQEINSTIFERSNTMIIQIREAQRKASNSDQVHKEKLQRLNKKLSEMASIFQKQEEKLAKTKQLALQIQKRHTKKPQTIRF